MYQVSNLGKVRSLDREVRIKNYSRLIKGRILKGQDNGNGYKIVFLYKGSFKTQKKFKIHRLVAQAFIDNPNNLPLVNHKDENKINNSADNLEWCDDKYNTNYGTANQRRNEKRFKTVYQYTIDNKLVKVYSSKKDVSKYGFNSSCVGGCCRGVRNVHKGYKWSYTPIN